MVTPPGRASCHVCEVKGSSLARRPFLHVTLALLSFLTLSVAPYL